MTQVNEQWRETAQDCAHCGGIILRRLARGGTLTMAQGYYRCAQCGCEWQQDWLLVKAGHGNECQALGEQLQAKQVLAELKELPHWLHGRVWLYLVAGLIVFILLARFGAMALLSRVAIPLLVIGLVIGLIWYAIRQR